MSGKTREGIGPGANYAEDLELAKQAAGQHAVGSVVALGDGTQSYYLGQVIREGQVSAAADPREVIEAASTEGVAGILPIERGTGLPAILDQDSGVRVIDAIDQNPAIKRIATVIAQRGHHPVRLAIIAASQ